METPWLLLGSFASMARAVRVGDWKTGRKTTLRVMAQEQMWGPDP